MSKLVQSNDAWLMLWHVYVNRKWLNESGGDQQQWDIKQGLQLVKILFCEKNMATAYDRE